MKGSLLIFPDLERAKLSIQTLSLMDVLLYHDISSHHYDYWLLPLPLVIVTFF